MEIDVEDVYFRLLLSEVGSLKVCEEGGLVRYKLEHNGTVFSVRRVRVVGRVEEVSVRGRLTECVITDGNHSVQLRVWAEGRNLLAQLKPGDLVEVLGKLRVYGGDVYVLPIILRTVPPTKLEEHYKRVEMDRAAIIRYRGEGDA